MFSSKDEEMKGDMGKKTIYNLLDFLNNENKVLKDEIQRLTKELVRIKLNIQSKTFLILIN